MNKYKDRFTIEAEQSKEVLMEEITQRIKKYKRFDDTIEFIQKKTIFDFFMVPGKIKIKLSDIEEGKTRLDCEITPVPFYFSAGQYIFLIILIINSVITYNAPLSIYTAVVLLITWILLTFISLYLILLIVIVFTLIFLISSFSTNTLLSVVAAWLIAYWIVHLTLRYRRVKLQRFLSGLIASIKQKEL
jgi:hypothetical protein